MAGIAILLILLVMVRLFQEQLFYDPFIRFFKETNYKAKALPQYDSLKLFLSLLFRYALNTMLSLAVIWLFFKDRGVLRLSAFLYAIFFVLLAGGLLLLLNMGDINTLLLFYLRRFLIQPLFLILFIPAFYYQRKVK